MDQQILTTSAIRASLESEGADRAPLSEQAYLNAVFQEFYFADDAVAACKLARAAATVPEVELPHYDRVAQLHDLWVSDSRICHVDLHARLTVPVGTGSGSTSDCLVVPERLVSEGEVVHASLGGCTRLESSQNDISDALARQHVTTNDSCLLAGVKEAAFGQVDVDWLQAALVQWDVGLHKAAQTVDYRTVSDTSWRVAVSIHLGVGPCEVELRSAFITIDSQSKTNSAAVVHQVLCLNGVHGRHAVFETQLTEHLLNGNLCVPLDKAHVRLHVGQRVLLNKISQKRYASIVGCDLRFKICYVIF